MKHRIARVIFVLGLVSILLFASLGRTNVKSDEKTDKEKTNAESVDTEKEKSIEKVTEKVVLEEKVEDNKKSESTEKPEVSSNKTPVKAEKPTETTQTTNKTEVTDKTEETNTQPSSNKVNLGTFKLTFYCPCSKCCGSSDGITASGTKATAGRTIAAPSNFKFGTKVEINGNTYVVEDRGGAIKGNRIDIFCNSHQEALNLGVQYAEVFVYN